MSDQIYEICVRVQLNDVKEKIIITWYVNQFNPGRKNIKGN